MLSTIGRIQFGSLTVTSGLDVTLFNQSISQYNINLAAESRIANDMQLKYITAYETNNVHNVHRRWERCVEWVRSHYVGGNGVSQSL